MWGVQILDTIGPKRINTKKGKAVVVEGRDGCLVCTSHSVNKDGYIRLFAGVGVAPRMKFLHRIEWEKVNGVVPDGYELDHKCRNRNCCNIEHLQLLTKHDHKVKTNKERYAERTEYILQLLNAGVSMTEAANKAGVCYDTARRIKKQRT